MTGRARKLSAEEEGKLKLLSPFWQRVAYGQVDLNEFTDEEILTGKLRMEDGRRLPKPKVYPQIFLDEQERRGMRVAQRKISKGARKSLDVYYSILTDKTASNADRMKAAQFFSDKKYGRDPLPVKVQAVDDIEELFRGIAEHPEGLLPPEDETPALEA